MQEFSRFFTAQYATYTLDLEYWISNARAQGSPLLELGCGSGRVLLPLAQAGFNITGLDNDPAMLSSLNRNIPDKLRQQVSLIEGDISGFSLPDRFNLIYSPCNTFSYLPLPSAISALDCIYAHLHPEGLLLLDLPNPDFLFDSPIDPYEPVDSFLEPVSRLPVQVYADQQIHDDNCQVDVLWHYDELHPDGFVQRFDYPITYYMRLPDVLEPLLAGAGFSDIQFRGGYSSQAFTPKSHRLIASARKSSSH